MTLNQLATPAAIAFDALGRLYIADSDPSNSAALSRVLVFASPFTTGMSASRIMGIPPTQTTGGPALTDSQIFSVAMNGPSAVFFLPGTQGIGVLDSGYHRILIFDPYDQWPDVATATSPSAKFVVGHASGISGIKSTDTKSLNPNDGNPLPSAATFSGPQAAVFVNNELYVADTGNNRVVVLPLSQRHFWAGDPRAGPGPLQYQFHQPDRRPRVLLRQQQRQRYRRSRWTAPATLRTSTSPTRTTTACSASATCAS